MRRQVETRATGTLRKDLEYRLEKRRKAVG